MQLAMLFQILQSVPCPSRQQSLIAVLTARKCQSYGILICDRVVGIESSLAYPAATFWRVRPPWFVPEEGQSDQSAIRRCALSAPLVKAHGELHPSLDFGVGCPTPRLSACSGLCVPKFSLIRTRW